MNYLLSPLIGSNTQTAVPASGAEAAVQAARLNEGQLPFHSLFNQQLQLLQQPGILAGQSPAMMAPAPWQPFAMGGQSLPLSSAGITPSSGITIESVTYSRISMNGNGILNTVYDGLERDPQNALAQLLANIGEPPSNELLVTGKPEGVASHTEAEKSDAKAVNRLAPGSDELKNPEYLGEKIAKAVANISTAQVPNAQFAVDHPTYGHVEARVDITDESVDLAFAVQDPELRAALEAAKTAIELALSKQGLTLAKLEVGPPQDVPEVITPGTREELFASYTSQLDAALNRIISDLALGVPDNRA